jgi:autophagy-related protein 18
MPLQCGPSSRHLLYLSFNQDYTCVSVATTDGIRIYNIDSQRVCYKNDLGAVRCGRWAR